MRTKFKAYTSKNFHEIEQLKNLSPGTLLRMEAVAKVLPFRTNNYITDNLINWNNIPEDPIFQLTFPQPEMLNETDLQRIIKLMQEDKSKLNEEVRRIQMKMNPQPAGQLELNTPSHEGAKMKGIQHKYKETVLFFPAQGQTCHAYCTYCFRWAQFIGVDELKMATRESQELINYLGKNPKVTDLLITGGDPMIMKTKLLRRYIKDIIESKPGSLKNIRIGTKALSYWPYRFTEDEDSDELISLFKEIIAAGFHLTIMAHFTHPVEMDTPEVKEAVKRILATGATIRCQSPVLKHINDDADLWVEMWSKQVTMGMIPYYMFVARDTGPKGYFNIPLEETYEIFSSAFSRVSGLARTARGPSMSTKSGKILIDGIIKRDSHKYFVLKYIQSRTPELVNRIFLGNYNSEAVWINDLEPAFESDELFFESGKQYMLLEKGIPDDEFDDEYAFA
ncbi:MAG: lysine 2,3-aminomutase [Spirochaetes bacterium]|nr:MAG: lysine 2,3-aminomutase [Spirochaetota bacterium]